ncbi:MAG: ABC transporter ATP-binding protein [Bacteroidia bacterium]
MKSLKKLNKYFLKYKWHLIGGIVFVSLSNLFAVFPAQSVRIAIDLVIENLKTYQEFKGTKLSSNIEDKTGLILLFFGILVIVLALFRGLFMYLMRQTIIVMSRHIEFDMKNEIYSHYQDLSLSFYRKNSTGDLMARISEDVSRVRMYVGPAIMYAINLVVTIILVLWAMFSVNTQLTWLVILPLPILSYSIFYVNNIINRKSDAIQSKLSDLTSFVQEAFSGIRVIKAFAAEKESESAFEEMGEDYRNKQLDLAKTDAVFFPLMFFLTGLSTLITIVAGGFEVLNGRASLGNIAEFVIYVNMLTWPVTSLGWTSSLVQRAAASQTRINEFLDTKPEIQSTNSTEFTFNEFIKFENIGLTYPEKSEKALKNINFTLKKGESLAILGNTGSGKTSLANLLLRLLEPTEGRILIDGNDLKDINLGSYRRSIGYVPQEVFLFSDSISNNISFGISTNHQNLEKIKKAADEAALTENINNFKDGFSTVIGERGVSLSGGQKQRVAIARAFLKNPEILIMDDCLSALDTRTESIILENLKLIMKGKTSFIISHRASSVKDANRIIVLENGEIIEEGNHDNLMLKNGKYSEIFAKQSKEE